MKQNTTRRLATITIAAGLTILPAVAVTPAAQAMSINCQTLYYQSFANRLCTVIMDNGMVEQFYALVSGGNLS